MGDTLPPYSDPFLPNVTKESSDKVDQDNQIKNVEVFENSDEGQNLKNGIATSDESKQGIKELHVEPNQETENHVQQCVNVEKTSPQNGHFSPPNGNISHQTEKVSLQSSEFSAESDKLSLVFSEVSPLTVKVSSPESENVSLQSSEISAESDQVSLAISEVSPQTDKVSLENSGFSAESDQVSLLISGVSPQTEIVSHQSSDASPQTKEVSPPSDKVSLQNSEFPAESDQVSHQTSGLSPQTEKVSLQSSDISPQTEKFPLKTNKDSPQNDIVSHQSSEIVSHQSSEISPKTEKVSPETGKVSPQLSPQIVVRFSNCSDDIESDLPVILNENDGEDTEETEESNDKENIFKEVGSDDSLTWEAAEDDTDFTRSSGRGCSYLAPIQMKLRKACREGDFGQLKKMLSENPGIKLDLLDEEGSTCLNESVTKSCQFEDVTKLLLEAGAGVGVQDQLGNTPLHNAVLYYPATQETIQMLLDNGADTSIRNFDGATPISMADDKDLKKVMRLLSKSGKNSGGGKLAAKRRLPYSIAGCENGAASPAEFKIVVEESPGTPSILKKRQAGKRKREEGEEEGEDRLKKRRIWFNEKEEAEVRIFSEDD